jgi:hypothetical protein
MLAESIIWNLSLGSLNVYKFGLRARIFYTIMEPRNRFQGMNSASLRSLAGRYDDPILPRCLAPIDSLKIPAQSLNLKSRYGTRNLFQEPSLELSSQAT